MGVLRAPIDYAMNVQTNNTNSEIAYEQNRSQERIARQLNDTNIQNTRETNQTQMDIWREQQQHDIDMWNMENQYNSPQAQIERLKAAGLNPYSFLEGAGNATSSAGGQSVPSLSPPVGNAMPSFNLPHMVPPNVSAEGIDQLAQAYKNIQEAKKTKSESEIASVQSDWFKEMALKGENPESLRNSIMLQEYTKLKESNKYITPFLESQIKKMNSETNVNKAVRDVRLKEADKIMEECGLLRFTNRFNAAKAPLELKKLGQELDIMLKQSNADLAVKAAQVKNLNSSSFAAEQAGLLTKQQTMTESFKTIQQRLRAKLSSIGINPDANNLPFYSGIAIELNQNPKLAPRIQNYFENMAYAEKIGRTALVNGNADLTKFELYGKESMFGTGISFRQTWSDWVTNFESNFGRSKIISSDENGFPIVSK